MSNAKDPLTDLGKYAITLFVFFLLVLAWYLLPGPVHSSPLPPYTEYVEPLPVDPAPASDAASYYRLVDRMTRGILQWKQERMWFCGVLYEGQAASTLARKIARHVVRTSQENGVNPWGVLGTMANESSLDLCALGLYPRKKAYELGVLKPSRLTISHTREQVLKAINNPELKKYFFTYDLGGLQVLDQYYQGKSADLLTWKGFEWQVYHMAGRSRIRNTQRPWAYWPGHHSTKYDARVTYLAKLMGATRGEI